MSRTLVQLKGRPNDIPPGAHVVVSAVRNETLRLPYFLSYYRGIGFDHFILIDNGSDDGTKELLLEQSDVTLFETDHGYSDSGFGMHWVNFVLDRLCHDRWILLADADEMLVWPGSEQQTIQQLTARLDDSHAEGLFTLLLDMYSDKPFGSVGYIQGAPFLSFAPFFDGHPYQWIEAELFPFHQIYGGVRARIFSELKQIENRPPTVSKLPLLRWNRGQKFVLASHGLAEPVALAPMRGALLHFKMFDDFPEKCKVEAARGQHFAGGREYRVIGQVIEHAPERSMFDPRFSVRFVGTSQLVSLRLMHDRDPFGT